MYQPYYIDREANRLMGGALGGRVIAVLAWPVSTRAGASESFGGPLGQSGTYPTQPARHLGAELVDSCARSQRDGRGSTLTVTRSHGTGQASR